MKFSKLEEIMSELGVSSLAEIARTLKTSPQAVSNWKSRDQVPYHIINKINSIQKSTNPIHPEHSVIRQQGGVFIESPPKLDDQSYFLSKFLLVIAQQLKVIVLITFLSMFSTYTYVKYFKKPLYMSQATVLLPSKNPTSNMGGLMGLASQFGVNVPSASQSDLSSPSLLPELFKSRTFSKKILLNDFYTEKYKKNLPLYQILTGKMVDKPNDVILTQATSSLQNMIEFDRFSVQDFIVIRVSSFEAEFSRDLTKSILVELEELNRFYKSESVREKTSFIESRIKTVENDLKISEKKLKNFNEQNRLISSPSLQLEQERLQRDTEIQGGIYLTLKQQLELAKIEEIQESSIFQVLDKPQIPLGPYNINTRFTLTISGFLGLLFSLSLAFFRGWVNNDNKEERKKLRKIKNYFSKKSREVFTDLRIVGVITFAFISTSPYVITLKLTLSNILYMLFLIALCFHSFRLILRKLT